MAESVIKKPVSKVWPENHKIEQLAMNHLRKPDMEERCRKQMINRCKSDVSVHDIFYL